MLPLPVEREKQGAVGAALTAINRTLAASKFVVLWGDVYHAAIARHDEDGALHSNGT